MAGGFRTADRNARPYKLSKEAALSDTQDLAEILLYAEAKLGEMIESIPNKKASSGGGTRSIPEGINKKQSHYAQQLNKNNQTFTCAKAGKAVQCPYGQARKQVDRRADRGKEEARQRGILSRSKGKLGFDIGEGATDNLFSGDTSGRLISW